jgi:beta-phosphoglucomutase-like phosphatase (HAD superfamily)
MGTRRSRLAYQQAKLVVFDFDGVIVNSNESKFDCFLELATPFGPEALARLKAFLAERPYATRFEVVESILDSEEAVDAISEDELLCRFSECSKSRILKLQVTPALSALREADTRPWALVSATEEQDMQEHLELFHQLTHHSKE